MIVNPVFSDETKGWIPIYKLKQKSQTQTWQSAAIVHVKETQTCLKSAKLWTCVGTICQKGLQITRLNTVAGVKAQKNCIDSCMQWFEFIENFAKFKPRV